MENVRNVLSKFDDFKKNNITQNDDLKKNNITQNFAVIINI